MNEESLHYHQVVKLIMGEYTDATEGKMMSSPGLKVNNGVFAFFHAGEMVFKLGDAFDFSAIGVSEAKKFNPFKNKGPLRGWWSVGFNDSACWFDLATHAYSHTKQLKK